MRRNDCAFIADTYSLEALRRPRRGWACRSHGNEVAVFRGVTWRELVTDPGEVARFLAMRGYS